MQSELLNYTISLGPSRPFWETVGGTYQIKTIIGNIHIHLERTELYGSVVWPTDKGDENRQLTRGVRNVVLNKNVNVGVGPEWTITVEEV